MIDKVQGIPVADLQLVIIGLLILAMVVIIGVWAQLNRRITKIEHPVIEPDPVTERIAMGRCPERHEWPVPTQRGNARVQARVIPGSRL